MNNINKPYKDSNLNNNKNFENLFKYEVYYLIKENNVYKIKITKKENEIIINCKNYKFILNNNNLSIITKSISNNVEQIYEFIINIFEQNKVIIKDIKIHRSIKLTLKTYTQKKEQDVEILLLYDINDINNNYYKLKNNIINLKDEINQLKKEINNLKLLKNNNNSNLSNSNIKKNSNPKEISFLKELTIDSFSGYDLRNTFEIFKSFNEIIYLVYTNRNKSIILYNLLDNKRINEIKNAHNNYISNFRYYLDNINKRDLIISISALDNNIKLWNVNSLECLLHIQNVNEDGWLYSACFLKDKNNKNYIITSNQNVFNCESIKAYDFKGNKIKEINDSNDSTLYIDSFYDNKLFKNYIITGNNGYIKSYDFNQNKFYHKYHDDIRNSHKNFVIFNNGEIIKLIESSNDGYIRIWNFHSPLLLNRIKASDNSLYGICLWDNDYLFVGCEDKKIKLIDLNKGKFIKYLIGHNKKVINITTVMHPKYGKCLISQGCQNDQIKLWINNNK